MTMSSILSKYTITWMEYLIKCRKVKCSERFSYGGMNWHLIRCLQGSQWPLSLGFILHGGMKFPLSEGKSSAFSGFPFCFFSHFTSIYQISFESNFINIEVAMKFNVVSGRWLIRSKEPPGFERMGWYVKVQTEIQTILSIRTKDLL